MKQSKETLKQFFETGDKPTQEQYADLIDSYIDAKQPEGEANRRFVIDENGNVSVVADNGTDGAFVTVDTDQAITGAKTMQSTLFTADIISSASISVNRNITTGGRIRTGGNALDFTENDNAGSATIKADIKGSTIHKLQGKSGTLAHLEDIPEASSVIKTAKIFISAAELESNQVKTIIPALGEHKILDIISVHSVFNFKGDYYGDAYLMFNHGIIEVSLSDVNSYNYVVKTSQGSQESRSIPVNTPFTVKAEGNVASGNDGLTIYVTYRVITTDGYEVAVVM